jgi:uncharacterized membrane protein YiaA
MFNKKDSVESIGNVHSKLRNATGTKSFTKRCVAYSLVSVAFLFINCFDHLQ